jgi:S-adenosyl-L-methionine hydrolase (adenosine-forming)
MRSIYSLRLKMKNPGIVTLITDFGSGGEYSGVMKGAILSVNPRCRIVDITHEIEPQNILQASWVLKNSYPYFPPRTIHVAVVDPGVGTTRRAIVLEKEGYFFVGPDNGVFSSVLSTKGKVSAHEITQRKFFLSPVSDTFHGRDLFAPVAGHLSLGLNPRSLGPGIKDWVVLDWPNPRLSGKNLRARVLWADSFGNLITNVSREECGTMLESRPILIEGKRWHIDRVRRTYGEGRPGEPMALFGSGGLLEISLNRGNALKTLGLRPGEPVSIQLR